MLKEVGGVVMDAPDAPSGPSPPFADLIRYAWDATVIPTQHLFNYIDQQDSPDAQVTRSAQKKELNDYLSREYPNIHNTPHMKSALVTAGALFKNLLDPVTMPLFFVPFSTPMKGALIGGAAGASIASLEGLAEGGEVNPVHVGAATALGVLGGGIGGALGKSARNAADRDIASLGYAMTKRYQEYRGQNMAPTLAMQHVADDFMTDISGVTRARDIAAKRIERELNTSVKTYNKLLKKGVDPLKSPSRFVRERRDIEADINDLVTNGMSPDAARRRVEYLSKAELAAGPTNPFIPEARTPAPWVGRYLGIVSDQLARIHPAIAFKLRRMEQTTLDDIHKYYDKLGVGEKLFHKLPSATQNQVSVALANGDDTLVKSLVSPELYGAIQQVRGDVFAPIAQMAKEAGHDFTLLKDYWPRHYSNFEGFALKHGIHTGRGGRENIRALELYREMKNAASDVEAQEKIRSYMTRANISPLMVGAPSNLLERRIDRLDITDAPFLTDPFKTARVYVHDIVENYHKRKFFGLGAKDMPGYAFDLDKSIDGLLQRELLAKGLRLDDMKVVRQLLHARFGPGEQIPSRWNQRIKNVFYGATLGDPASAVTQLGDIGTSLAFNGVVNTLRAVLGKRIRMEDVGLRKLYEELSSTTRTAKWLDRTLTASGFNTIDRFGKSTYLTAALYKLRSQVGSERGLARFVSKYQPMFTPDELASVINDLRIVRGIKPQQLNPNTRAVLFSELADVQPVVRSAMPQGYLENPNGRMMYMLKTFVIRQMNTILSKTLYNPSGVEGAKNAIRVGMLLMGTGAGIDSIKRAASGKEVNFTDATVGAMLRTFMLSQYIANQALSVSNKGKVNIDVSRALGLLATPPPVSVGFEGLESILSQFSDDPNMRVLRNVPFGRFIYDYVLGLSADKEK